jgi:dihydrolipoamide dehydrogenase
MFVDKITTREYYRPGREDEGMKEYGLIVVGSGAGMNVIDTALALGHKVALVEEGPLGGTCLNRGCIPSKVLIHAADVIRDTEMAERIGLKYNLERIDYSVLKKRMWEIVLSGRHELEDAVKSTKEIDHYPLIGKFVGDYTMQVGSETIKAPRIVLATGARARIPPTISGLDKVKFQTYRTIFDVETQPESIIIIGGGYVGCEFAHFFSAIGTKVTLLGKNPELLPDEEPETRALVKKRLSQHADVHTGVKSVSVEGKEGDLLARVTDAQGEHSIQGQMLLMAAGVRSNTDWLKPEATGVRIDKDGWIMVNEYLETSKPNIYSFGDALGRNMFRHTANYESAIVRNNLFGQQRSAVDLHAVPHAVFTDPQVGAVGMTEEEAKGNTKVMVGLAMYHDTAMGFAFGDLDAFVKVIVEYPSKRVLGGTVVGPQASTLVQQIVLLMNSENQTYGPLARSQVIHPALSEVLASAFGKLTPVNFEMPEHHHEHR